MASKTLVSFLLGEHIFGIDILNVREVNKQLDLTKVQHTPKYVSGLVNLRGQIVTVLDLNQKLGMGISKITSLSHNIILKTEADVVGLLVDEIGDIITVDEDDVDPSPANLEDIDGKYFSGVLKLESKLMTVLSVPKILEV